MSEENVNIVKRIYRAWEDGSPLSSGLLAEDIDWVNPGEAVEPGTRHGVSAFGEAVDSVTSTFEGARVRFEEFIDAGEKVVVIGTLHGIGQGSGLEIDARQGYVWTIRDGKAVRFEWFNDPDAALESVGLSR
ncbi:MAG: nuclear transport factor 2 family protein [Solirubrobacterales bacterium]